MIKTLRQLLAALAVVLFAGALPAGAHEKAIADFLNRIGGAGASELIVTELVGRADGARESFTISSEGGKPKVTGNSLSAITTGIGWYLNHYAGINLSWNQLTTTFSSLPAPAAEETRTVHADFRHYLNYCTFSYSMSTWTWDRWQQEIDWMALHGINAPLQIVGLEEVWRKLLMEDYGYTKDEANAFVGGPSFMAWFSMNNLQGHGGPNPDWWYERQARLGGEINARMRELGMQPVIPGFAGMVPSDFTAKTGIPAHSQGNWCGFLRPFILATDSEGFSSVAANYYKRLHEVMGESKYYGIDPFHEGGSMGGVDAHAAYNNIYNALNEANRDGAWVMQQWQFSGGQWKAFDDGVIPKGRLVVLDLYSDGKAGSQLNSYQGHHTVYCMIPNFGARTGLFGRIQTLVNSYWDTGRKIASVNGVGAVPEGIEQVPMIYDLLYEMAWMDAKPDPKEWVAEWSKNRYGGSENPAAAEAWELLRTSALNCPGSLQGPHEAITCSRPALTVNEVSSWGGADIFYDTNATYSAAYKMLAAGLDGNANYSYDLTDIARQALTDYSKSLLAGIREAHESKDTELFNMRRDAFLRLMLDIDELLNTNSNFMLGHWTERARAMAGESTASTDADRDWLELNNARTLISTWGGKNQADGGGLRDYSYRQWGGMMKDYYYARWKQWFDNGMSAPAGGWYDMEHAWAMDNTRRYPDTPAGSTAEVAGRVLPKYLSAFTSAIAGETPRYIPRMLTTDLRKKLYDRATRGEVYSPSFDVAGTEIAEIAIDLNKSGLFEASEAQATPGYAIAADANIGEYGVRVTLADGTVLLYTLTVVEEITEPRRVAVATSDPARGSVSIDGTDALEVTNTEYVVIRATPTQKYDFSHWTDAAGNNAGNDNPMTYYGKDAATFTAQFADNRWGVPDCSGYDKGAVTTHKQFFNKITVDRDGNAAEIYSTDAAPDEGFVSVPSRVRVAPGGSFTVKYQSPDGAHSAMFVTAYVDKNRDYAFAMDENELIVNRGAYSANLNGVGTGEFTVLMPFDAPAGTTHMRIRYDSSWNAGAYDSGLKAMRPDASTNRLIYEVLLDVLESPEYAATVTARVNNPDLGSLRTENSSNVYLPGEEVIITAFPNPGVHVEKFVDQHGRTLPAEWVTDSSIRFKQFGNAEITVVLALDPVTADGWEFIPEEQTDGTYRLASVAAEGNPVLDLSRLDIPVSSISPTLFAGNTRLTEVTLPDATLTAPGAVIHSKHHAGNGTQNEKTTLANSISGTTPWVMTIKGETGNASYNEWGTAIFANGTDATARDYSNGWSQFYLQKRGVLCVKWDGAAENLFSEVILSGAFTIRSEFDGNKTLKVTVTNADGQSQTKTLTNTSEMKAIQSYVNCIPAGMDFTLTFEEPAGEAIPGELFAGCRSLTAFHAPAGSTLYTERDGLLFDARGRAVAYPEGRLFTRSFRLKDKDGKYVYVNPLFRGTEALTDEPSRQVKASADMAGSMLSIWRLVDKGEGGLRVTHANSLRNLGGVSGSGSANVAVPADPENWHGYYDYRVEYLQAEPMIDLFIEKDNGDIMHLSSGATQLVLDASATDRFAIVDVPEVKATLDATHSHTGMVSPLAVTVPADVPFTVNIITAAKDGSVTLCPVKPGVNLAPFEPLIIARGALREGDVTYDPAVKLASADADVRQPIDVRLPVYHGDTPQPVGSDNLLVASPNAQADAAQNVFTVDSEQGRLTHQQQATISAGSVYLPKAIVEEALGGALTDPEAGLEFSEPAKSVTGVTITTPSVSIVYEVPAEGQTISQTTYQFTASCTPAGSDQSVIWSIVSGPAVIDANSGVLTPTGIGDVVVKATSVADSEKSATATVTVSRKEVPCTKVEIAQKDLTLLVGGTARLTATATPANATSGAISWSSDKADVATVAADGTVTAVAAGTATITASCGDASASVEVTVNSVATGLNFTSSAIDMKVGDRQTQAATLAGEHTVEYAITYLSGNTDVATVDASTGEITAVEAGRAVITATATPAEGSGAATLTATLTVDVTYPEISFAVTPESLTLVEGRSLTLTVKTTSGVGVRYGYSSDDEGVVTVSDDGTVTAVGVGTAEITVTGTDRGGNSRAVTVRVTVEKSTLVVPDNAVSLNLTSMILHRGATAALCAEVAESVVEAVRSIVWSSDNTKVAEVAGSGYDGTVTAVGSGRAVVTVTVTFEDETVVKASCTVNVMMGMTGIEQVNVDMAEGRTEVYDLQGRRLRRITSAGIYIVAGEKMLVK